MKRDLDSSFNSLSICIFPILFIAETNMKQYLSRQNDAEFPELSKSLVGFTNIQ